MQQFDSQFYIEIDSPSEMSLDPDVDPNFFTM